MKKKPWKPVERPTTHSLPKDSKAEEVHDVPLVSITRRPSSPSPILEETVASVSTSTSGQGSVLSPKQRVRESVTEINQKLLDFDASLPPPKDAETGPSGDQTTSLPTITVPPVRSDTANPSVVLEPSHLEGNSVFADFAGLEEDGSCSDATDDTNITARNCFQPTYQSMPFESQKETLAQPLQYCSRSITAPPIVSLVASPPSKHRTSSPLRISTIAESESDFSSSVDSFHSVQSWHSPLAPPSPPSSGPPSPTSIYPYPHNNIILPKRPAHHTRDVSELTVTPETPRAWAMTTSTTGSAPRSRSLSPPPRTPTLVNDTSEKSDDEQFEIITPPTTRSTIRHRATTSSNSRRRELSPLPAPVNLFSPPRRRARHLQTARHLPTAIIQKTWEILLSPPSHLLHLMLNIASKIAAGEWRGVLSGNGESVHWDFEDEYAGEGWMEDDYGISLPNEQSKTKKAVPGGSWEVD